MSDGPIQVYRKLLESGEIHPDPNQALAAEKLQTLHMTLQHYAPQMGVTGWKARLSLGRKREEPPLGLYMYGGVGRGKSMLMEMFYNTSTIKQKQHIHFHVFMKEVHERLHNFREAAKAGKVSPKKDPLAALARIIADQAWLLCFDEMQITDIADAMILGRLFEVLFEEGVVIVTTSNRPPSDLYKDGLQREKFIPFIKLFEEKLDILDLDGPVDHRLARLRSMKSFSTPVNDTTDLELKRNFDNLTTGVTPTPANVPVKGRQVHIPLAAEGVAFASFDDLCDLPLGASDYLKIAELFHTVIISRIPKLGPNNRDAAKRFVTMIDAFYEAKTNLVCSAETPPQEIYTEGDGAFEFDRTVSRLMEMQADDYIAAPHRS
jgi:cell division protein ZapE